MLGNRDDDAQQTDRRTGMFVRFILDNMGGFIAALGVVYAAGILSTKLETVEKSVFLLSSKVETFDARANQISLDIAIVKTKVETIEREQGRLRAAQ